MTLASPEIIRPERIGKQFTQRSWPLRMIDEQLRSAVFEQHLTAASARHQNTTVGANTGQREEASAAPGMEGTDHSALGTET